MTHDEEFERILTLYRLLVEEAASGHYTIRAELEKPKSEQDVHYMMGQSELNVALHNAAMALEESGLIDDDQLLCYECCEPIEAHDDDGGDEVMSHPIPATKPDANKPN